MILIVSFNIEINNSLHYKKKKNKTENKNYKLGMQDKFFFRSLIIYKNNNVQDVTIVCIVEPKNYSYINFRLPTFANCDI